MKYCPTCNRQYEGEDFLRCPYDGSNLIPTEAAGTDPLIGQQIGESYQIVRILGEGGMGKVYEARHVRLSKRYAVKVLHPQFNANPETIARFRREAEAATAIGQENILEVIDFNQTPGGVYYIVTEFLDGRPLSKALAEDGIMKIPRVIGIMHQVARALAAAHRHEIVHRDMKPDNIFLVRRFDSDDFVKVLDFGISKVRSGGDRLTQTGQIIGTPHYMSPEQAQGELNLDHRSDIYSVGAIMYEMFTGHLPFNADSIQQILVKLLTENPPPPRLKRPDLPVDIEAVILRCMAKNPAERFQTMEEVEAALTALWQVYSTADGSVPGAAVEAAFLPTQAPGSSLHPSSSPRVPPLGPGPITGPGVGASTGPGVGQITQAPPPPTTQSGTAAGWGAPVAGDRLTVSKPKVKHKGLPVGAIVGAGVAVVALAGAAIWFFAIRDKGGKKADPEETSLGEAMGMNDGDRPIEMEAGMKVAPPPVKPDAGAAAPVKPDAGAAAPVKPKRSTKGMVLVKGGTFTMGRAGASKYEGPPVAGVKVPDFYLDEVEVSVTRYAKYLKSARGKGVRVPWTGEAPPRESLKLPVTLVTWQEAGAYCQARGKRLPREAEWEYAARGPKHDQLYPWGEKFDPAKAVSSVAKTTELQPVRSGTPIDGLYHLIGNAWEWVADEARPYPGAKWAPLGTQYVIRGGGAETKVPDQLTATYRLKNFAHENPKTKKLAIYKYLGFRCALDAVEP